MRRNAESLLVLAGAEPNRKRGRPVPLADVVRAALAEVEDFSRLDLLSTSRSGSPEWWSATWSTTAMST